MIEEPTGTATEPGSPFAVQTATLLARLTLPEKIALLHQYQAPVPRLGIAPFRTGTEALHGLAWLGPATVFPQAIGLASTWDPELVRRVGAAVGDETRAFHHKDPAGAGLNVWAPVVNPLRDPRWGRNEEGYAEDPWLVGVFATAYARGLRGDHPVYLKTAPTLKHFLAYNNETDRHASSSNLRPRVLHEYELPAFRAPLVAGAAVAVMPSYNLVNGRPAHLSPLINGVLRRLTEDELLVVSDAGAPGFLVDPQGYHPDHATAYAAAVRAGLDSFTMDDADPAPTIGRLTEALDRGLLTESDVDTAVARVLSLRFRLGEFDPPEANPYAAIGEDVVNCPAHQVLAREAARQSIVLLKHECGVLPFVPGQRIAVIGPLADSLYEDWYSGTLPYSVTALAGLRARADTLHCEGVDRVALRLADGSGHLVASDDPDGAPLRTQARPADFETSATFDVFDWGRGSCALRAVANGRHVSVDDTGTLVNNQPGPNGWIVRETFRLAERGDGATVLRHIATERYVTVQNSPVGADARNSPVGADAQNSLVRANALDPDDATPFVVEVVTRGAERAAAAARAADVAVVVVGNHPMVNGRETEDRQELGLPPAQEALVRAVHEANPRTVLVVSSSYPFAVTWAQAHLPAVLWSSHGGQEYGHALTDALFGTDEAGAPAEPGGRLTQTWYRAACELPDLLDYDIIATDATYLYYRGTPLYPFGHGLSYTTFEHQNLRLSADTVAADGEVTVSVDVVNTGTRPGAEVVQLYTHQQRSRVKQPLRQLRGFARVHLTPGERSTVSLRLAAADLAFWDVTRRRYVVETARHKVLVGRSATAILQAATLHVRGERIPPRDPYAAPLWAIDHDDHFGVVLRDEGPGAPGDVVGGAENGGWVAFEQVDFGAGGATWRARVAGGPGRLVLRLDDPFGGTVIGALDVAATAGPYAWTDVGGALAGASGLHDLYLVFETPGTIVTSLEFGARS
jgi:beta-glucosidase